MTRCAPWQGFVDAAVGTQTDGGFLPDHPPSVAFVGGRRRKNGWKEAATRRLGERLSPRDAAASQDSPVRRSDLRMVPAVVLVWGAAAVGGFLPPAVLGVLCVMSLAGAVALIRLGIRRGRVPGPGQRRDQRHRPVRRSLILTFAVALLLAAAAAAHSAVASKARNESPFAALVKQEAGVVAILEVAGTPRHLGEGHSEGPSESERWEVAAVLKEVTAAGSTLRSISGTVGITVMGGDALSSVSPGQLVRATGKLSGARPGDTEAGILAAATVAAEDAAAFDADWTSWWPALQAALLETRTKYVESASRLPPDARGLLPGMVTGDTSALDADLKAGMRTVGMSHLTAVSGANCSLIVGALLMLARTLRLPRAPAAVFALVGLGLFVLLVGPEPSVMRAAFMGCIAVASLAGGRPGRGLSLLCLATVALLLVESSLATDVGFVLSVAATLGIVVLAGRMLRWASVWIPQWLAALVAVPLSAQVFCGPIVVLLQPAYSSYALAANVLAAPLVAPVTVLGTAALPFVHGAPWLTAMLNVPAGLCSEGIAMIARFMAGRPGAALPWPDGPVGVMSMLLLSVLSVLGTWALLNPGLLWRRVLVFHGRIEVLLDRGERVLRSRG